MRPKAAATGFANVAWLGMGVIGKPLYTAICRIGPLRGAGSLRRIACGAGPLAWRW